MLSLPSATTQRNAVALARLAYDTLRERLNADADDRAGRLFTRAYQRGRAELESLERTATDVTLSRGAREAFESFLSAVYSGDSESGRMWLSLLPGAMRDLRRDAEGQVEVRSGQHLAINLLLASDGVRVFEFKGALPRLALDWSFDLSASAVRIPRQMAFRYLPEPTEVRRETWPHLDPSLETRKTPEAQSGLKHRRQAVAA
jgi:hypothetical protein